MKAKNGNDQPLQVEKDESTMQASDNSSSADHQQSGMARASAPGCAPTSGSLETPSLLGDQVKVVLDNLRDPNWKAQLEEFLLLAVA